MTDVAQFLQGKSVAFRSVFEDIRDCSVFKRWANVIIKRNHSVLPTWVKKNMFYSDMRGRILYLAVKKTCPMLFLDSDVAERGGSGISTIKTIAFPISNPDFEYLLDAGSSVTFIPSHIRDLLTYHIITTHLSQHGEDILATDDSRNETPPITNLLASPEPPIIVRHVSK